MPLFIKRPNQFGVLEKKYVERDIVQFIKFKDIKNDPKVLAKKVMTELPKKLTDYFYMKGIKPLNLGEANTDNNDPGHHDSYFNQRKKDLLERRSQIIDSRHNRFDPNLLEKWIDFHGIPEDNDWWVK